jgi:hypothetical protein
MRSKTTHRNAKQAAKRLTALHRRASREVEFLLKERSKRKGMEPFECGTLRERPCA